MQWGTARCAHRPIQADFRTREQQKDMEIEIPKTFANFDSGVGGIPRVSVHIHPSPAKKRATFTKAIDALLLRKLDDETKTITLPAGRAGDKSTRPTNTYTLQTPGRFLRPSVFAGSNRKKMHCPMPLQLKKDDQMTNVPKTGHTTIMPAYAATLHPETRWRPPVRERLSSMMGTSRPLPLCRARL